MDTTITLNPRAPVLADLLPGAALRDLMLVLGSAAFVGLSAQVVVPLPWTPVPMTGQTFAVLLSGAALGPTRAVTAMSLYLIAGVAGVPLFAEGESGWGGPSFGYIIGFLVAGGVVGYLAARDRDRSPWQALPVMLLGSGIIYVFGVPWLMAAMQLDPQEAIELGVKPFVGGDLIKVAVAATVLPAAWRLARRWD